MHRLVAEFDPTFEQHVLDLSQREWITDPNHHRDADHVGQAGEILETVARRWRPRNIPPRLKPICIDIARFMLGLGSFCKGQKRTSRSHCTILGFSNSPRGRRLIRATLSGALHSALRLASDCDVRQVIQDKHVELELYAELVFHLSQRPESQQ